LRNCRFAIVGVLVAMLALSAIAGQTAAPTDLEVLTKALGQPLTALQGKKPACTATLDIHFRHGKLDETGQIALARGEDGRFALSVTTRLLSFALVRDAKATRLLVPSKKVAIIGEGPAPQQSDLEPSRLFLNIVAGLPPEAQAMVGLLHTAEPGAVALLLQQLAQLHRAPAQADKPASPTFVAGRPIAKGTLAITLAPDASSVRQLSWNAGATHATIAIAIQDKAVMPSTSTEGLKVLNVPRAELEEMVGRGLAAFVRILRYSASGTLPRDGERTAGRGRLVVKDGRRLVMLQGTPYEIGHQHGRLLGKGMGRLIDGVLFTVGLYYSVEKRVWFLDVMRGAWKRLLPHIPKDYLEEMRGLADGSGQPLERVQLSNVFPALFHCSGFAVFGKATQGGKLYHGRVLDYMTDVGLQRDAAVFVVKKDGAIPFANVSYAGFIGSVSGMNAKKVAFGEMGGRGEGWWDGTPMPILMRMGLERANTLADACRIFRETKRTCEYYYVISDGKIPDAVGVAAFPDKIDFLRPGQVHKQLPTPVDDCVLMSSGRRYQHLVRKTKAKYGQIDTAAAIDLMRRPVAMRSNLHDVLFVPQDLVLHVANARGRKPACDQPYARYDLAAILADMAAPPKTK